MYRQLLFFVLFLLAPNALVACAPTTQPESAPALASTTGQTWMEVGGVQYGARPDERGPIGGGAGYRFIVTDGDQVVRSLDELLEKLKKARPGQVLFLPSNVVIDVTARRFAEDLVIEVPAGVTLASDRGRNGSQGALIRSDAMLTRPMIRVTGPGARITGLRVQGPDPQRRMEHHERSFGSVNPLGRNYFYKLPVSRGIETAEDRLEVDNCELSGWSHAAIFMADGKGHSIHHNYIHHNQLNGLGYGVALDRAQAIIQCNLFNFNRHSIAGTGRPGCGYEALNNIQLEESLSHCFDMHGGINRNDGTDIAGTLIQIHHNTFLSPSRAIRVNGRPQEKLDVHHNWFRQETGDAAVHQQGNADLHDNAYGAGAPVDELGHKLVDEDSP